MRRNLLLAQALQHSPLQAVVLMIAGAREASLVTGAAGVDCVALPSLWKDLGGQYRPRHLDVPLTICCPCGRAPPPPRWTHLRPMS